MDPLIISMQILGFSIKFSSLHIQVRFFVAHCSVQRFTRLSECRCYQLTAVQSKVHSIYIYGTDARPRRVVCCAHLQQRRTRTTRHVSDTSHTPTALQPNDKSNATRNQPAPVSHAPGRFQTARDPRRFRTPSATPPFRPSMRRRVQTRTDCHNRFSPQRPPAV